jgi:hypothetical protein
VASSVLNGTYSVTVTSADEFRVTVADVGDVVGNVTWYEKSLTLSATLNGPLQGNIPVNVASVELGTGDEFLFKDVSDSNRIKTTVGAFIKAWAKIDLNYTTITGTVTRTGNTATITKTGGHNLRVGDVIYTTDGIANSWYAVFSVPSSTTFTVITAVSGTISTPVAINWYQHTILAGTNVHCAYGQNNMRCIQVGFTNKPPTVNYINSFNTWGNFGNVTLYPVQTIQNTSPSAINSSLYQTVNGFGFWLNSTGGTVTSVSGQVDFQSIW